MLKKYKWAKNSKFNGKNQAWQIHQKITKKLMRLVKMNSTCYVVVSSQDMNGFHWLIYVFYAKNMDWQKNCQRIRLRQSLFWGFVIFCVLIFNQNIPRLPNSLLSIQFNKNQPSRPKLPPSKGHPDVNRPTTKKKSTAWDFSFIRDKIWSLFLLKETIFPDHGHVIC